MTTPLCSGSCAHAKSFDPARVFRSALVQIAVRTSHRVLLLVLGADLVLLLLSQCVCDSHSKVRSLLSTCVRLVHAGLPPISSLGDVALCLLQVYAASPPVLFLIC
jgi:hypothetical protein